jgi:hypothetical protein
MLVDYSAQNMTECFSFRLMRERVGSITCTELLQNVASAAAAVLLLLLQLPPAAKCSSRVSSMSTTLASVSNELLPH